MKIKHTQSNPKIRSFLMALLSALVLLSCTPSVSTEALPLDEPFRPQYHFTPPTAWLNDPNGMVYYDGEYHLFYQYHPDDTVWGPMHWGHAVSEDLVNWMHLPIALYPDDLGTIFSGSAVIDWHNTAGFGEEAMVAIFTHAAPAKQRQSLAYSTDRGRTWTKYEGNPVLNAPNNIRDFRDPKVFWYDSDRDDSDDGEGHWVMAVAAGSTILFFTSPDLKTWEPSGGFGFGYGATEGVWETPDLFELPVDGGPETRWVMLVSIGDGAPAGGSGIQYFVGDFDGKTFTSENPKETTLWVDLGADFYAAQSWSDAPDERRLLLAWMNNWSYAQQIPTSTWRGAMSIPRQAGLTQTAEGIRLVQYPVDELAELRGKRQQWKEMYIGPNAGQTIDVTSGALELIAEFQVDSATDADHFGIRLSTAVDEFTAIGYIVDEGTLYLDRTDSGNVSFNPAFAGIHRAAMQPIDDMIRLHLFVDHSSVEVFGNDGTTMLTDRVFPSDHHPDNQWQIELFAEGGTAALNSLALFSLHSARFEVESHVQ